MSRYQGNEQRAGQRDVEMEKRLLDDIVGAGSELVTFTIRQDFIQAKTCYEETIKNCGLNSPEALEKKARLDDVISRLHPMDR